MNLITIIIFGLFVIETILLIAWIIRSRFKEAKQYAQLLMESNKKLDEQVAKLTKELHDHKLNAKTPMDLPERQEHELQGEYEADENTYNQIIQEWIYGEVKEDGENSENN